jgi:integrase
MVARNVATLVDPPALPRKAITPFNPGETQSFLQAAHGDRLEALYVLAITTGLRQGELLGLHWSDVDLEERTARVRLQLQRIRTAKGWELTFTEPKTGASRRAVKLTTMAVDALRSHRQRQLEERLRAGGRWREMDLVFASTIGTPMDPRNVYRLYQELLERSGLPRRRFHDLRHSFASLLLLDGIHPKVVQELLGHSTITLTMDTYSHLMPALQENAAERLDALLRRSG